MASAVSGLQSERFTEKYFYLNSISTPFVQKKNCFKDGAYQLKIFLPRCVIMQEM